MEVSRARAITEVAGSIIESAKVEVEMVKAAAGLLPEDLKFFGFVETPLERQLGSGEKRQIAAPRPAAKGMAA